MTAPRPDALNLRGLTIMLLQGCDTEMAILTHVLGGLGCWSPVKCATAREARGVLGQREIDMIVVDAALPDRDGYSFTEELRRTGGEPNRSVPIILLAGHTRVADVHRARDCGASLIVVKPATPRILYDRIVWLARDRRPFIDCPAYCGPDRRFRRLGPPPGTPGRRRDDPGGAPPGPPDLEIDAPSTPQKAAS